MKSRLKINGVIIFIAVALLVLFPRLFFRSAGGNPWDGVAKIYGVAFVLLGQILRASGRGYKSEHSQGGHSLIQDGPYAFVRNPMYLGILLIGSGVILILLNWWVLFVFLAIFIWRYITLMFQEERKLLDTFSAVYQNYRQKVPRLLPSLDAVLRKEMVEYLPLKVAWLRKEIGSMLALLLLVFFLEAWQAVKSRGAGVYAGEAIALPATIILYAIVIIYLINRTENQQRYASDKSQDTLQ